MNIVNFNNVKGFLLDNKTVKQTIFKNTFWLVLGVGISRFLGLILMIYIARILGATEYGKFSFALAFVSLFFVLADLEISTIVVKEFSREKEREKELYSLLSLKILLGLGTLIFILIGSFFIISDPAIQKIILILAIFNIISGFSGIFSSFFLARQRMEYHAWMTILGALILTLCGFFVIFNFPSAENLSYAYLVSGIVALIFVLVFFHLRIFPLKVFWHKSIWKRFLAMSWPLALAAQFVSFYTYIGPAMMGYWGQITETGWYSAAFRLTWFAVVFTIHVPASFYPMLSKFFGESKEEMQKIWNYQTKVLIILTVPLMVGGIILASKIINFLYGLNFEPSILVFQILMIMTGIVIFYTSFQNVLIISNHQLEYFWAVFSGAIINIVLNSILIPKFSLYGAAIATVITHLLIFFLLFRLTKRFAPIKPFNLKFLSVLIGTVLSSGVMFSVISRPQIYNLNIFLSIPVGALVYFVCFFLYQKLTSRIFAFEKLKINP